MNESTVNSHIVVSAAKIFIMTLRQFLSEPQKSLLIYKHFFIKPNKSLSSSSNS
jgi:hypothetical protein